MIEIQGDFWDENIRLDHTYDAICCTTNQVVKSNGRLVMGAGIARQFRDVYNGLDLEWGNRLSNG